jgi:hypothetical protein
MLLSEERTNDNKEVGEVRLAIRSLCAAGAVLAAGSVAIGPAAASITAPAATCSLCGPNLIKNPGAEAGSGTDNDAVVKVPDWKQTAGFTSAQYAWSEGDLSATTPGPKKRGKNYFYGGPGAARSTGTQTIALAATGYPAKGTTYTLSGWLGGYSSQGDDAILHVTFKSSSGKALGSASIGPVGPTERHDNSELLHRAKSGTVPAGSRSAVVELVLVRQSGSDNDGMADRLGLVLSVAKS